MGHLDYVLPPKTGVPYDPAPGPSCAAPVAGRAASLMTPVAKVTAPHAGHGRLAWARTTTIELLEGEARQVALPLPWNVHAEAATLSAISSSPVVALGAVPRRLPWSRTAEAGALAIAGLPARVSGAPGTHRVIVRVRAEWTDGDEADQLTVIVKVRPRDQMAPTVEAGQAPVVLAASDAAARSARDAGEIATAGTAADTPEPGQLSDERQRLTASLGELFDHQKAGVDAVANDAHGYQRKPAPAHISWGDLVSLAVSLGTAGVAGVVSKAIGGAIDGLAGDAAEEVTMAFATGLEQAARGAVATGPISGDASKSLASFFLAQTDMLVSAQGRLARRIIDGNAPLRRAYAADAPGTLTKMKGATAAVDAQHAEASAIQRAATTASLGRYLARAKLGSEVVRGAARGASMEATPIESLATHRAHAGGGADPKGEDGVLDLFIPVSAIGRPGSTVKEARLTGIGRASVAALAGRPIATLGMPARIVLGRHLELQARITVDEAGRATFGGDEGTLEIATSDLPETASIDERVAAIVERVRAQVVPAAIEVDDAR